MATLPTFGRVTDADGIVLSGAKRYIYTAGTTDAVTSYSDKELSTAQTHPQVADAAGVFDQAYVPDGSYKVRITDADGVLLLEWDNLDCYEAFTISSPTFYVDRAAAEAADTGAVEGIIVGDLFYTYDATGTALETDGGARKWSPQGTAYARHWGAVLDGSTDDTAEIQAAINWVSAQTDRTRVIIDGDAAVSATAETDTIYADLSNQSLSISERACLVIRSNCLVELHGGATVTKDAISLCVFGFLDATDSGLVGVGGYGRVVGPGATTGGGPGVAVYVSSYTGAEDGPDSENILIQTIESTAHGGYGIQFNYGNLDNVRIFDVWIHDVGADGIDSKARYGDFPATRVDGLIINGVIVERFGLRTDLSGSAGLDLRGHANVTNAVVLDFADGGSNTGIRCLGGTYDDSDPYASRMDMRRGSISSFYIDSGDPSDATAKGLALQGTTQVTVANGSIVDCATGILVSDLGASSRGVSRGGTSLSAVSVLGSWDTGIEISQDFATVSGCSIYGTVETFRDANGNLDNGQTEFTTTQDFDPSTVEVYLNDELQTVTTDYTISGTTGITMTSGVDVSDVLDVVTPTQFGLRIEGSYVTATGTLLRNCTSGRSITEDASDTFSDFGTIIEGEPVIQAAILNDYPVIRVVGPDDDYDLDLRAKGDGSLVLRNGNGRMAVFSGVADAVNWPTFQPSVTGSNVVLTANGDDADISISYKVSTNSEHSFFVGATERMTITGTGLEWNGTKVLGSQQSAIADSAGSDEVTKINAILAAMRAHGLIAT